MFHIIYSIKNLKRYKSNYIINFIFLLLIAITCITSYLIVLSFNHAIDEVNENLNSRYTIRAGNDDGTFLNRFSEESINKDDLINLLDSEYIDEEIITISINLQIEGFYEHKDVAVTSNDTLYIIDSTEYYESTVFVEGYYNLTVNDIDEFKFGICKMTNGRFIQNDNEIIISSKLAEINNITIGDVVTAKNRTNQKLLVVGIYEIQNEVYDLKNSMHLRSMSNKILSGFHLENVIYSSFSTVYDLYDYETDIKFSSYYPILIIDNESDIQNFKEEITNSKLPFHVSLIKDKETIDTVTRRLSDLNRTFLFVYIFCMPIGAIVLVFITLLFYSSRKYEIAVFCSMGKNKSKILISLFIENSIFIFATMIIGFLISIPLSSFFINIFHPSFINWFDIKIFINIDIVLTYLVYGLALICVTTLLYAVSIIKYKPYKQLTDK